MELRPIADLEQWYARELTEAFPPNERKPLAEICALLEAGRYEALGLYDGAALLGYANLWREPTVPGYVLLDYLGVTASRRNGGWGASSSGSWLVNARGGAACSPRPSGRTRTAAHRRRSCAAAGWAFMSETGLSPSMRWRPAGCGSRRCCWEGPRRGWRS